MGKLVLLIFLGVVGFYGWHWLGPLPATAAQDYARLCLNALPDGDAACQCAASNLEGNSSRLSILGIWSADRLDNDRAQARLMREEVFPCIRQTRYAEKVCQRDYGVNNPYCGCVQGIYESQTPSAIKRALDDTESGGARFADTMKILMAEIRQTAHISCR